MNPPIAGVVNAADEMPQIASLEPPFLPRASRAAGKPRQRANLTSRPRAYGSRRTIMAALTLQGHRLNVLWLVRPSR